MNLLRRWLEHPLTRGLDLDNAETTRLHQAILAGNPFLKRVYQEWYTMLAERLPPGPGAVLELGSGAGFLRQTIPRLISSDVIPCGGIDVVLDGCHLPFTASTLRAVVMTNVLHHVADVGVFLSEAARCIRPGGALVLVEPWVTRWSRFVYRRFHHEPFDPEAARWHISGKGRLTAANGALPWIVFERDSVRLEREWPEWRVERIEPVMPFRYMLSGGVSMRSLMPGWAYGMVGLAERTLQPWRRHWGMFALIVVRRTDVQRG